jgi:hypothetical protein
MLKMKQIDHIKDLRRQGFGVCEIACRGFSLVTE